VMVVAWAMTASRAATFAQRPIDHQAMTPVWASWMNRRPRSAPAWGAPGGSLGVITKPSRVERWAIVGRLGGRSTVVSDTHQCDWVNEGPYTSSFFFPCHTVV